MKMRNMICLVVALCMLMSMPVAAKALSRDKQSIEMTSRVMPREYIEKIKDTDPFKNFKAPSVDFLARPFATRSTTVWVSVTEPCDQYFRQTYPSNWMWQANRTISGADDPLQDLGIRYYSVAQKEWTSNNTDSSALVAEAKSEWGLTNNADLMIAFSGRKPTSAGGYGIFGQVDEIGDPYVIVYDYGYDENIMTTLHETGHAYGLWHCALGTKCVMAQASPASNFNLMCSKHEKEWKAAKNKY